MEFGRIWVLRGPNRWARCPALEVELRGQPEGGGSDLGRRLLERLPEAAARLPSDTALDVPHALLGLTLALQSLAGSDVRFGLVRAPEREGPYRVVIEYEEEDLARAC